MTRQTLLWLQAVRAQCGVAIDAAVRLLTPLATDFPASARAAARLKKPVVVAATVACIGAYNLPSSIGNRRIVDMEMRWKLLVRAVPLCVV